MRGSLTKPMTFLLFLLLKSNAAFPTATNTAPPRHRTLMNSSKLRIDLPVIPIIGPVVNAKPLMIGGEMMLDQPTPLQWKALQECVVVHRNRFHENADESNVDTATIQAAPLIAIIDEATGLTKVNPPYSRFREGGRYATLAAVVGITKHEGFDEYGYKNENDEENFMEYMNLCPIVEEEDFIVPLSSSVRLVGVGRAVLRRLFYRVPSELCPEGNDSSDSDTDIDVDEELDTGYEDNTPIVMSEFEPIMDDASIYSLADPERVGEKGERSYRSSPVHALSALNNISIRVSWMHDNRRTLIAGIKAAKARLNLYDKNLSDHDGLGILFGNREEDFVNEKKSESNVLTRKMTVDEFLATFKGNMLRIDASELPQNQSSQLEKLEAMENYGLGYYGSFSSIDGLTKEVSTQLRPYYSPMFRDREEYPLEVLSFVAFRVLDEFAAVEDISWSLQCTSSIERLNRAYEIMLDHTLQLKMLAEKLSVDLEECGEECTDLFPRF